MLDADVCKGEGVKPHADKSEQGGRKTGIFEDFLYGRPLSTIYK